VPGGAVRAPAEDWGGACAGMARREQDDRRRRAGAHRVGERSHARSCPFTQTTHP
jgi:hypothetical protein